MAHGATHTYLPPCQQNRGCRGTGGSRCRPRCERHAQTVPWRWLTPEGTTAALPQPLARRPAWSSAGAWFLGTEKGLLSGLAQTERASLTSNQPTICEGVSALCTKDGDGASPRPVSLLPSILEDVCQGVQVLVLIVTASNQSSLISNFPITAKVSRPLMN